MWTPFCRTELCRPTWLNSNQHFLPRTPSLPYTPPPFKIFNCSFIGYDFSVSIIMSFLFGILFSFAIISFSYRVNNCVSCNSPFSLPLWGVSVHIYLISLSLSLSLSLTHTHTHTECLVWIRCLLYDFRMAVNHYCLFFLSDKRNFSAVLFLIFIPVWQWQVPFIACSTE